MGGETESTTITIKYRQYIASEPLWFRRYFFAWKVAKETAREAGKKAAKETAKAAAKMLSLNIVNLLFLILGIVFHRTPIGYVRAITRAASGVGGHHPAVPVLCRDPGHHDDGRGGRSIPCGGHQRGLCEYFHSPHLPGALLSGGRGREFLRALRWRTVGGPGADNDAGQPCPWGGTCRYGHGHCLGRRLDQHAPALLGAAGPGDRRAGGKGYYGVLRHCADGGGGGHGFGIFVLGAGVGLRCEEKFCHRVDKIYKDYIDRGLGETPAFRGAWPIMMSEVFAGLLGRGVGSMIKAEDIHKSYGAMVQMSASMDELSRRSRNKV